MLYLLFMIPALLLATVAQLYVSYQFSRGSKMPFHASGREVAEAIVERNAPGVSVVLSHGFLTDHYDPSSRQIRLSPNVFYGRNISAAAVAAHEAGHAIQHYTSYLPLKMRSFMVPAVMFGTRLAWIFLFTGLVFRAFNLALLGLAFFSLSVAFSLVTLPVEIDASLRALKELKALGLSRDKEKIAKDVLIAAALTYVAALFSSIMEFLYYLLLVAGMRRDE